MLRLLVCLLSSRQIDPCFSEFLTSNVLLVADQFIACGKSMDEAHELVSQIWLAVLNNLEENEHTFLLLKRLALEADVTC